MNSDWAMIGVAVLVVVVVLDYVLRRRGDAASAWRAIVEQVEKRRLVMAETGIVYHVYVVHYRRDDGGRDFYKLEALDKSAEALALISARAGDELIKRAGQDYPEVVLRTTIAA